MFKMPFIPETPSSVRTRAGGPHDVPESSARATPGIAKSVSRDNLLLQSSTARNFNDREEFKDAAAVSASLPVAVRSFDLPQDPSFWKDHNVQVIIRLRPLNSSELSTQGYNRCIRQDSSQTVTWTGHPESRFTFDVVADETITQEKLFKVAGVPMVDNCVAGYNSCMFAYGQTGSGKTHTMLGDIEGGTRRHSVNCGMTPRVFDYLFSRIQKEKELRREEKFRFTCKCSFLEIYNEHILDLLNPSSVNLQIREDLKKGIYVENLTELEVTSAREMMQQLLDGAMNRKVAATNMNRASSRSHSVFTCVIESTWESQGVTHHRFARLNLVDLAGSERQKSSGAEGERLKEATNINKSLSTLGLVIMNLVSISNGKSLHVPYRDSKLTFLLQDSLGGNSKTIIIANISPSTCCSLETLSTLKFAQRAKFIKNNAIINEDASGDVLAMRMQIQQLKKEVSHLRSLHNGGSGNHDSDMLSSALTGSPGAFKWEGLNGTFSPLTSDKRLSQKKEYEAALVGAFRREKDKDMALQALTAENQAVMQLAKQREDEIQGLKMRLRFREAGIKRLEAVASGKISAEAHLLKEKEEYLREIDVLRAQVNKNQEVTRFAMENLRLKEEIRRLKSFSEEGEREQMNEQIITLQNKLLEALDWKLMHESDPSNVQRGSPGLLTDSRCDSDLFNLNKESVSPWQSSVKEENEFLRMQAIQNQAEIDSLQKKLDSCTEEKEKLERNFKDLETELKEVKCTKDTKEETQKLQAEVPPTTTNDISKISFNDQLELKAMVDAIAAASQREAEAHEMAITLAKENDELRAKIKVLIEDNNKLIDLYERAVAENDNKVSTLEAHDGNNEAQITEFNAISHMKETDAIKLDDLEHQLTEMHEENEKLMSLYEKAMQERDDLKRMLSSTLKKNEGDKGEIECPERLVEIDEGDFSQSSKHFADDRSTDMELDTQILSAETEDVDEGHSSMCNPESTEIRNVVETSPTMKSLHETNSRDRETEVAENYPECVTSLVDELDTTFDCVGGSGDLMDTQVNADTNSEAVTKEELIALRTALDKAREKLSISTHAVREFGVLEKLILEVDEISKEAEAVKEVVHIKRQEYESIKTLSSDNQARKALLDNKLAAIKVSLFSISSSIAYFEQREGSKKEIVDSSVSSFDKKKESIARLQVQRDEINSRRREIQAADAELRNNLLCLKSKLEAENQRQDSERVLLAIDNIENNEITPAQNSRKPGTKATELLKSAEEKSKLQAEIQHSREKLGVMKKEMEHLDIKGKKVENEIQVLSLKMQNSTKILNETELELQNVIKEKEILLQMIESGKTEIDTMIGEYQLCVFEDCFRVEELEILQEDTAMLSTKLGRLESEKAAVLKRATQILSGNECQRALLSEKVQEELEDVQKILEAKALLCAEKSN